MLDLKLPENSVLLYGRNIRNQLPEVSHLQFDYEDVLIRSLYHLNKSLTDDASLESMRAFTKGVFKFGFYLCSYFDPKFRFTSIVKIAEKIKLLVSDKKISSVINSYLEEAVIFRITSQLKTEFAPLRDDFVRFLLSLLTSGTLHKKMGKKAIIEFFRESFGGFGHLIRFVKKLETLKPPKIIEDKIKNNNYLTPKLQSFGIKDAKMRNVICPHCSSKCSTTLKFCGICGEPLPK